MTWVLLALVVVGFLFFGKYMVGMKKELNALQPESLVRTNGGELVKRSDFRISQLETQVTLYNQQHSQLQQGYANLEQKHLLLQQDHLNLQNEFKDYRIHTDKRIDELCETLRQSSIHTQNLEIILKEKEDARRRIQ